MSQIFDKEMFFAKKNLERIYKRDCKWVDFEWISAKLLEKQMS